MTFEQLQLHEAIVKAVGEAGYTQPTPIQAQAIPQVLEGHDIMASAQTGTGKTAAFMLPALHKLAQPSLKQGRGPRVVVLTPTRELAQQITQAATNYSKYLSRVRTVCVLGGMPYHVQNRQLSMPYEILVATPGRLIDHLDRGTINFSRVEMLVLDEADRMLDMGFIDDVERIVKAMPQERQTLLFSATLKGVVGDLAKRMLKNPVEICISDTKDRHENIDQRIHYVDDLNHKNRLLAHLLEDESLNQTIVFTATKRHVDQLVDELVDRGHRAAALHGDMSQRERNRTISRLRRGDVRVLVATDVAARGIDIPGISHVINYDFPQSTEDYVHRIGRTGRAGATGIALSFASSKDILALQRVERYTGQRIKIYTIPGLEPKFQPSMYTPRREDDRRRRFGGRGSYGSSDRGPSYGRNNRRRPSEYRSYGRFEHDSQAQ